jgi:hypothetical protein
VTWDCIELSLTLTVFVLHLGSLSARRGESGSHLNDVLGIGVILLRKIAIGYAHQPISALDAKTLSYTQACSDSQLLTEV